MNKFEKRPVTNSLSHARKPIYGIAINDAQYQTTYIIDNKIINCPISNIWRRMLRRCLCEKFKVDRPAYKDCSVIDEWLTFSNFERWVVTQDWEGKQLDKDLLIQGNKIYSPNACIFVSNKINTLLTNRSRARGSFPLGVIVDKRTGRYIAKCNVDGVSHFIGGFSNADDAHEQYKKFKYKIISKVAHKQAEPLRSALLAYVIPYR